MSSSNIFIITCLWSWCSCWTLSLVTGALLPDALLTETTGSSFNLRTGEAQRLISATSSSSTGQMEWVYARRGGNATLPCSPAAEQPEPRIFKLEWLKDHHEKLVEIEDERMVVWQADDHVSFQPETAALSFKSVTFRDVGEYTCRVNGARESLVRLVVQDVPASPGRPLVIGFSSRSANLSWAASFDIHNAPILFYIISVRIGENGEWDSAPNSMITGDNSTFFTVENLQPFTVYSFRLIAVNTIGQSPPSLESYKMVTLRENPEGKPQLKIANVSSTSIELVWAPPPRNTMHGEFTGYKLRYWAKHEPASVKELLFGPDQKVYTLNSLSIFTNYQIQLSVFNPQGVGPPSELTVMTADGAPSAPVHLKQLRIRDSRVEVEWKKPESPNGIIQEYRIYVVNTATNSTDLQRLRQFASDQEVFKYTIENLRPFTSYKIFVKAYTSKEGQQSQTLEVRTDVQGPSSPFIRNLTCNGPDTIYLEWERPATYNKQIDYYFVLYKNQDDWVEQALSPRQDQVSQDMTLSNLTINDLYEVKIQGATRSIHNASILHRGEFSQTQRVILKENCESIVSPVYSPSTSYPVVVGLACFSIIGILAIASFLLWRKYFQAAYYYLDDPPSATRGSSPQLSETYDESEYSSIPVSQWPEHVQELHADGDLGFSREYQAIQAACEISLPCEHSQKPDNKHKNRYVNIVAYDHSRVVLKTFPIAKNKSHTDYINANYIDGYNKSKAYIGTQGPLPATFDDYWRMIWEQRVCIIVMITNLVERGRRKCDLYWPKDVNASETYGIITVKMLQEVIMATYTLRTFTIRNNKVKKGPERTVYQYHYTNWPDHGVPDHPLPVLSFVRKSSTANPPNAGPIIVHCSAGVGRTGTYIVIDAMLKQIKHKQTLNIFGFLKHIRQQRNYLVQTEEQYIFTHDALLEAIESGDTEVPSSHLTRYIQNLQTGGSNENLSCVDGPNGEISTTMDFKIDHLITGSLCKSISMSHWPLLEKQFKLATSFRAKDFNVISALKPCNKGKNRSLNLIPLESHRVHITPRSPGTDGSDYINATFFPGFNQLKEFIVTQHPVNETIADFWQMVWDHNAITIVVLSSIIDEKEFPQFWPEKEDETDHGSFKVKLMEETTMYQETGGYITTRDFIMQSTQDDYELTCRIIHCPSWPESCGPLSSVFDLIRLVQEWHLEQNSPVIVVDKYGGTEAATFCALTTLYKQLNFEDCVDVYMYAKLYHLRRPGIWRSQDDYLFLYRAMESLVATMSISDANDGSTFGSQLTVAHSPVSNANGTSVRIASPGDTSLHMKTESIIQ